MRNTMRWLALGLYLAIALIVWIGFAVGYQKAGAQGLANLGLVLVVFPLALIDFAAYALWHGNDIILAWSRHFYALGLPRGYMWEHAYYYFPRVAVIAWLLWYVTRPRTPSATSST